MKNKIKNFLVPFLLMIIINLGTHYFLKIPNFGGDASPHLGILLISSLFFGIYGALGSVIGNLICDIIKCYNLNLSILSAIISFLVIYLGYKLWFTKYQDFPVTTVRLNNTRNLISFFMIIIICGILYSVLTTKIVYLTYPHTIGLTYDIGQRYFVNFVNFSILFSIIGVWILRKKDFAYKPQISKSRLNPKIYKIIEYLINIILPLTVIIDLILPKTYYLDILEIIIILILIAIYDTKPITEINEIKYQSITEKIIDRFLIITFILGLIGILTVIFDWEIYLINIMRNISQHQLLLFIILLIDVLLAIFFIPSYFVIRYVEKKVVNPLISFSKIESQIKEDETIELNDLTETYSKYTDEDNEIGMLSRSYVNLIKYNNNHIQNLKNIEIEKQRIKTELDIAHKIQESILPTEEIITDNYYVTGYSKAAKEVGGDFYDYYEIDEDYLVFVIGDSSGKGVPAALFSTITQNTIQQRCQYEKDPAKILTDVNKIICKNNTELMFITLWLGIYNKKTGIITFSNAGHNRPLIKDGTTFKELTMDSGIVMGIDENFTYKKEEIKLVNELILYTDGITDAQNNKKELYGEKRLINVLNNIEYDHIPELIRNIEEYCGDEEQYDDMTLIYLKIY